MKVSGDKLSEIIDDLTQEELIDFGSTKIQKITTGVLEGYKVKITRDGEHKHDGQFVGYTFAFTSPKKIKSTVHTEMCLCVGWNFCGKSYTIK